MKRGAIWSAFVLLGWLSLVPSTSARSTGLLTEKITGGGGVAILIRARSFTPGDIMLLTLENPSLVRGAMVRFQGRDYRLSPGAKGGNPLAFIGLDLDLRPGPRPISATFLFRTGRTEVVDGSVTLRDRKFPLKRLQLAERYVTAPPEESERIRREAEMVAAAYRDSSPDWLGDGLFELPHQGLMFFNFGDRRIYNSKTSSVHSGVDIEARMGDPIAASNAGRVVLAADLYFSGKTVIIDHGLGVFTSYFHMSRILARTGELVPKGRILGEAGSTGRSTGPHLHWGVRVFDSRVDPRSLLRLPLLDWQKPAGRS